MKEEMVRELVEEAEKVARSRKKGKGWCEIAVPTLVSLNEVKKKLDGEKKAKTKALKEKLKKVEGPYKELLAEVERANGEVRERAEVEADGENVRVEGIGEMVWQDYWTFDVVDVKKVPEELLEVNGKEVREQIRGGVRNIRGLRIYRKKVLRVVGEKVGQE